MLTIGLTLLLWAGLSGDLTVRLVVIIPIITGTSPAAALGTILTIVGLSAWAFTHPMHPPSHETPPHRPHQESTPSESTRHDETDTKAGGILLIGPIPIAWGSDRSTLLVLILATTALIVTAAGILWLLGT